MHDANATEIFSVNQYGEATDNGDGTYSGSFTLNKTRGVMTLLVYYGSTNGGYQEFFTNIEGTGPKGSSSAISTNFMRTISSNTVVTDGQKINVSGKFHFILK